MYVEEGICSVVATGTSGSTSYKGYDEVKFGKSTLKTWTVPVSEDTASNVESWENEMLYTVAGCAPLLKEARRAPSGSENRRIMVPFNIYEYFGQ